MTHSEQFHIAASHPALSGHFPGNPVVPGVVMLDHVASVIERLWKKHVVGFPQVKFLRPLRAEQNVELIIEGDEVRARFQILSDAQLLVSGMVEIGM
jgi:3-hydroxyacyl-[acyl-carrier-protein] dehydratase